MKVLKWLLFIILIPVSFICFLLQMIIYALIAIREIYYILVFGDCDLPDSEIFTEKFFTFWCNLLD